MFLVAAKGTAPSVRNLASKLELTNPKRVVIVAPETDRTALVAVIKGPVMDEATPMMFFDQEI